MMSAARPETGKSENPLDAKMTPTQIARRRFKSALPRTQPDQTLSKMAAMAKTMELLDKLRNEMEAAGASSEDTWAALVYYQPETKGREHVLAEVVPLPKPEKIGEFVEAVAKLDKPRFLGMLFLQSDPGATKSEYKNVLFAVPFMSGPDAQGRLLAARMQQQKGGAKKSAS